VACSRVNFIFTFIIPNTRRPSFLFGHLQEKNLRRNTNLFFKAMCHKPAKNNNSSRDLGKNTYYPATNILIRMKLATLYADHLSRLVTNLRNQYKFLWRHTRSFLHKLATRLFCILSHSFMFSAVFHPPCVVQKMCLSVQEPTSSFISRSTCCLPKLHLLPTITTNTMEFSTGNSWLYSKSLFVDRIMYLLSNLANQSLYSDLHICSSYSKR
jgi:hypothetical protein